MDSHHWVHLASFAWLIFLLYWIVSAQRLKQVKQRESWETRIPQILFMVTAYFLLFRDELSYGWLGRRFVPLSPEIGALGVALTVAGVAFAIWARWHLGENWSGSVTLKEGHELIAAGPYRRVRHPIYTGMLLALIGTALALGEMRGIVAVAIALTAFYFKARKEESFLAREFGASFEAHARRTGMFLPRFS